MKMTTIGPSDRGWEKRRRLSVSVLPWLKGRLRPQDLVTGNVCLQSQRAPGGPVEAFEV